MKCDYCFRDDNFLLQTAKGKNICEVCLTKRKYTKCTNCHTKYTEYSPIQNHKKLCKKCAIIEAKKTKDSCYLEIAKNQGKLNTVFANNVFFQIHNDSNDLECEYVDIECDIDENNL